MSSLSKQKRGAENLSTYILVVDDEPDVEHLFRQQFRRDIRSERFIMEFAASAPEALERAKTIPDPSLILILSDINMPEMSGLEMLPKVKAARPNVPPIMINAFAQDGQRFIGIDTCARPVASPDHRASHEPRVLPYSASRPCRPWTWSASRAR